MEIQITMLDVGDADAIIVHLKRDEANQLVILIDGGLSRDGKTCIAKLTPILKKADKTAPDLVICTHYDEDHIMGLVKVVKHYGDQIAQVWMHQPGGPTRLSVSAAQHLALLRMEKARPTIANFADFKQPLLLEAERMVLESYLQMRKLVDAIAKFPKIRLIAPFPGTYFSEHWPELEVLGPTKAFYDECVAQMDDVRQVIDQEAISLINDAQNSLMLFENFVLPNDTPCQQLKKKRQDPVSLVNQISLILQITVGGKRYLFTGDASETSFLKLPGYPGCISDIHWLKVPHHGSHNNISPELIDLMAPAFADISGGPRYLNDLVKACLEQKVGTVRATRDDGELLFPILSN